MLATSPKNCEKLSLASRRSGPGAGIQKNTTVGNSTTNPNTSAAATIESRCTISPVAMAMAPPPLILPMVDQTLSVLFSSSVVMLDSHPPSALW